MKEDIEIVEKFLEVWPKYPKESLFRGKTEEGQECVAFAFEIEPIRLLLVAVVGKKGGVSENAHIVDTSQQIFVDKLLLSETITRGDGHFLPLRKMRNKVRTQGADPMDLCIQSVREQLAFFLADRDRARVFILAIQPRHSSVSTVRGGLPSLGSR